MKRLNWGLIVDSAILVLLGALIGLQAAANMAAQGPAPAQQRIVVVVPQGHTVVNEVGQELAEVELGGRERATIADAMASVARPEVLEVAR